MKTLIQIMLVLTVYITLVFAQQPVTITAFKDVLEDDLAGFNIYQDKNETPIATIKSAIIPWVWTGEVTVVNGVTSFRATAFDTSGNESGKSPAVIFDPPPGAPTITIKITVETPVDGGNE